MKDSGRPGPIEITRAGPDRLGILAPLFGHAFVDDPMMGWTLGEPPRSPDRYIPCFAAFLERALPHGVVWEGTAHGDAGTAVGAAVWIPPGRFEKWADHPWNQPRILELTDDGGRRYDRFWQWVDEHSPTEPAWLLDSVAVEPAVQGRGFGSALITAGLDRARTDGQGAYLSTGTERNVTIYERLGFRVVKAIDAPDQGPHIWFMRSKP